MISHVTAPGPLNEEEAHRYMRATGAIDSDHPAILQKAAELSEGLGTRREIAVEIFYFVRDRIRYNPFMPRFLPEHFRASSTLARGEGFCIQKAVLVAALSRAAKIPARIRFAVLKNHLLPEKLSSLLKGDELPDHGFAEIYIDGTWVKANASFDIGTCRDLIVPVEFDGKNDAMFHPRTRDGRPHIEYVLFRNCYDDVPVDRIIEWVSPVLTPEGKKMILGA